MCFVFMIICSFCLCTFQLGYVIYRRVLRYYSGEEDGLGESAFSVTEFTKLLCNFYCLSLSFNLVCFQIWGKHCLGMWKRNLLSPSKDQSLQMNWSMIKSIIFEHVFASWLWCKNAGGLALLKLLRIDIGGPVVVCHVCRRGRNVYVHLSCCVISEMWKWPLVL